MSAHKRVLTALITGLVLTQPAVAQEKAVSVAVRGGGFNAVTDLNEAGTADFKKTGYNVGGTVGIDLSRWIGLRGDFTFARNDLQANGAETGLELNRFFYDAGVQFQYDASAFKPYLFIGAGAVTLHPVGSSDIDKTEFAGTGGLGVNYVIPGTNLGLLIEGKGWVYEFPELNDDLSGFDKTQFDVTWSAGLSYRFPTSKSAASR